MSRSEILEHREAGIALKAQAVLFRASHHSGPLEVELTRRNIPFVKFGGLKFLEAAHVKEIELAVLKCSPGEFTRLGKPEPGDLTKGGDNPRENGAASGKM